MLDYSNIDKETITLSPKEKADELCRQMLFEIEWNAQPSTVKGVAKACAIVAVNQILKVVNPFKVSYWKKVKEEINKL